MKKQELKETIREVIESEYPELRKERKYKAGDCFTDLDDPYLNRVRIIIQDGDTYHSCNNKFISTCKSEDLNDLIQSNYPRIRKISIEEFLS